MPRSSGSTTSGRCRGSRVERSAGREGTMGTRTRRPTRDQLVLIFPTMLMLVVLAPAASAVVASCRVTNVSTQQVYEGSGANLQNAINQAGAGTTLRIR